MNSNICLIGNPNCGKTSLFNLLTGTYQKTGNRCGVTTESKTGRYKKDKRIKITDLPGLYSLSAFSEDESAVLDYLKKSSPDAIINVVDGTNLERNLYLTFQLKKLNLPVVIAVNMIDDLKRNKIAFNPDELSDIFGVPVVGISAKKGIGIDSLVKKILVADKKINLTSYASFLANVYKIKNFSNVAEYLSDEEYVYKFIESKISKIISKKTTKAEKIMLKVDNILLNPYLGIPIFFCVITLVYFLSVRIGGGLSDKIGELLTTFNNSFKEKLTVVGVNSAVCGLLCDAVLKGIGSVVAFLPQILVLYFLMTIIEESGYAARITFLFDKALRTFGFGGQSIMPFVLACGCNVTGLAATKTIENKNEKYMTVFLLPNVPCGAKTVVFGWFSYVFFDGNPFIAASMYFLGFFSVLFFGSILKKFKPFKNSESSFLLEIPLLRFPSFKSVFFTLWRKTKDFMIKAGSVIFAVSVIIWLLTNFGISGYTWGEEQKSFLYSLGNGIKYLLYPLGVKSWECSVAFVTGIFAKEAIIETLTLLSNDYSVYFDSVFSVYAFMIFILLSPPCVATLTAAKKELSDSKLFVLMIVFELLSSYAVAMLTNFIGNLILIGGNLLLSVIFVIIIAVITVLSVKKAVTHYGCNCAKRKYNGCGGCKKCLKNSKHNTTI